jgi:blue copper oxidase
MKRAILKRLARAVWVIGGIAVLIFSVCTCQDPKTTVGHTAPLPIPPLLQDNDPAPDRELFTLVAQKGTREFFPGVSVPTYAYNGNYLGPVLRVHRGHTVTVDIQNRLEEATTLHWHGLEVDGAMDGGPFDLHGPGDRWQVRFIVDQPAATLWYHPHPHGSIGKQIYKGLSGLLLVDDDVSDKLPLPKEYGVNDIPLIIQDRRFDFNRKLLYLTSVSDLVNGMIGNTIVVNGAVNPSLEVGTRKIRFRLLNASNASIYNLSLSDGSPFFQIASDGGLLESPVEMTSLSLSPGERAEIVVDFSRYRKGTTVYVVSPGFDILKCVVTQIVHDSTIVPQKLASIQKIPISSASVSRTFVLEQTGTQVAINNKQFSESRVDERVKAGSTEIWDIYNAGMSGMMGSRGSVGNGFGTGGGPAGMMGRGGIMGRGGGIMGRGGGMMGRGGMMMGGGMEHPFHMHSVQFQVIERNGAQPPQGERGWKDTVLVYPGERVRVIARFMHKGKFVYHCHILEHDDLGMMGTFTVE